jgi:hypothetical protein
VGFPWSKDVDVKFRALIPALGVAVLLLSILNPFETKRAFAAVGSDFDANFIISDANFFDASALSAPQIQDFLNSKVAVCDPADAHPAYASTRRPCLKDYTQATSTIAADQFCSGYQGAASESAATVIAKVSAACGISPKVLLVLLEKESSLVTDTWPLQWQYSSATGNGCPDTAACDPSVAGFFYQVYFGARAYQRYVKDNASYNFHLGQTQPVRYQAANVEANFGINCGARNVYMSNWATVALYIYTPYTPNAAALNNIYGSGDNCSAYGNRNFWVIFSDWFGDPRSGSSLVRTIDDPMIYLITPTKKYAVRSATVFSSFSTLGTFGFVSSNYLAKLTTGPDATNLVRNESTLEIFIAGSGTKNLFPSCDMVARWGFGPSCGQFVDLTVAQLSKFRTGSAVTQFAAGDSSPVIYYIAGGMKRTLSSYSDLLAIAGNGPRDFTRVAGATLRAIPAGPDYATVGKVFKFPREANLYLVTGDTSLTPIATGNIFSSFGLSGYQVSTNPQPTGWKIETGGLTLQVACGPTTYVAGGGSLWPMSADPGLPSTTLTTSACSAMPKSKAGATANLFLRDGSTGQIFSVVAGKKQFMTTMAEIYSIAGSTSPVLVPATKATLDSIATENGSLAVASLAKSPSDPSIYFIDGTSKKLHLPSFALANALGITTYTTVSRGVLDSYVTSSPSLGLSIRCDATSYIASGGSLWQVPATAGLPVSDLDSSTCASLPKASQVVVGAIFLRDSNSGQIFYISGGTKSYVTTWAKVISLSGVNPTVLIPSNSTLLATIPTGPPSS